MKTFCITHATFCLLTYIIISCSGSSKNKNETSLNANTIKALNIDVHKTNSRSDFSNIIQDIEFVHLSNKESCQVSGIRKIKVNDSLIVILTENFEVFAFSREGDFIFKKEVTGKGKNELLEIRDFTLAPDGNIYILSYNKYFKFDRKGNFLQAIRINMPYDFTPVEFEVFNNSTIAFSRGSSGPKVSPQDEFSVCLYDTNSKSYSLHLPAKTCNVSSGAFSQSNAEVLIEPVVGIDTIYKISKSEITPIFYINFGSNQLIQSEIPKDYSSPFALDKYALKNQKCYDISYPVKNNHYFSFNFVYGNSIYNAIHILTTDKTFLFECNDNGDESIFYPSFFLCSFKNDFYTYIHSYRIKDMLNNNKTDCSFLPEKRRLELLEQLKNVKETDNPVLMLIKTE